MAGSTWGIISRITTWGESHGKDIGVVVGGCPIGLELLETDIQVHLDKRKPGQNRYTTMRQEGDQVEMLSGMFEGRTTGMPISPLARNQDQRSHDYSEIMGIYRPGYADYASDEKYGFRDYRGGGRSSDREIIGRVAADAVTTKLLGSLGVQVMAYIRFIGDIEVVAERFSMTETGWGRMCIPDAKVAVLAETYLDELMEQKDSVGGVVECMVDGIPAGIGEAAFDKLDVRLAQAVMSVGAAKSVGIGDGFAVAKSPGFGDNDEFYAGAGGGVEKRNNRSGDVLGGTSGGGRIVLRATFKPTPSIASEQYAMNRGGENVDVIIKGHHDPTMVPRAVVMVECMTALTILNMMLCSMTSWLDRIVKLYDRG